MNIVVIGNSAAAINAVEKMRSKGSKDKITMISKEIKRPYSRVLLPYHLRGKLPKEEQLFMRDYDFYEKNKVEFINDEVLQIDENSKKVRLKNNEEISYDKLLITSGSSPFTPPIEGLNGEGVYHMWTYDDAEKLKPYFEKGKSVLVLGSGFVSLQAAWAAIVKELNVYVYELLPKIMPRVLDDLSAEKLSNQMRNLGVDLNLSVSTQRVERLDNGKLRVHAKDMKPIDVDFIIVGTGVRPNTQFLKGTSVNHERGILVDDLMRTTVEDIYAAGDVANGPTTFGDNMIHALWPTAVEEGKIAGANILGFEEQYDGSLNMNVTQMFDLTVASMGNFMDDEKLEVWNYELPKLGMFKLILDNNVPVGASLVGKSELVEFLGILRPIIRKKKEMKCTKDELFRYLRTKCDLI